MKYIVIEITTKGNGGGYYKEFSIIKEGETIVPYSINEMDEEVYVETASIPLISKEEAENFIAEVVQG
jgi:hypothetical protein